MKRKRGKRYITTLVERINKNKTSKENNLQSGEIVVPSGIYSRENLILDRMDGDIRKAESLGLDVKIYSMSKTLEFFCTKENQSILREYLTEVSHFINQEILVGHYYTLHYSNCKIL